MLSDFISKLLSKNKAHSHHKIQSFTFFIPAPPNRSTGYREKQFDKLFYDFINKGFEIISFHTESCSGANQSGMWVICLVRALNTEASKLNLNEYFNDRINENNNIKDQVDGLYYINDISNEEN